MDFYNQLSEKKDKQIEEAIKKLENKINKLGKKILENVLSEFKVYLDKI